MPIEPTYEALDPESGEPITGGSRNKLMEDALAPKTPLQSALLAVSKAKRFASTAERARWRKLEKKAQGADPDSRLFYAWLEHCVDWGTKKNRPVPKMPYTSVIAYAENEQAGANWMVTNRSTVLRKKTAKEVGQVLEAKTAELDALYNDDE